MKDSPYFEQTRLLLRYLPALAAADCFALKGGTALNLFVRDLPRLSVDIDLAYLPLSPRDEALDEMHRALASMAARATRLVPELRVLDTGNAENPKQLVRTEAASVKVEPNPVLRGTVFPPESRRLVPAAEELFELSVSARTVSHADLYAGKLCAALDRQHARDWFDVRLLLDNEGVTEPIRQAFVIYLASHARPMAELLAPRAKPMREVFSNEFGGMSREQVTVERLESAQAELPRLLVGALTVPERQFLLSIKLGEPDWSLLPIPHASSLPALQWKVANIQELKRSRAKHAAAVDRLRRILEV